MDATIVNVIDARNGHRKIVLLRLEPDELAFILERMPPDDGLTQQMWAAYEEAK